MAASKHNHKCGACFKTLYKNTKSVLCFGNCNNWFHITCVNISNEEYELLKELKGKAVFMCATCIQRPLATSASINGQNDGKVDSDEKVVPDVDIISSLMSQVSELSANQAKIKETLGVMVQEKENLKTALSAQMEAVSEFIINHENSHLYANKLKNKVISDNLKQLSSAFDPQNSKKTLENRCSPDLTSSVPIGHQAQAVYGRLNSGCAQVHVNAQSAGKDSGVIVKTTNSKPVNQSRPRRQRSDDAKPRTNFITGSGQSPESDLQLVSSERKTFLFVSRLSPTTKADDLTNYLEKKIAGKYVVEKLPSRFPEEYSTFKVGIPSNLVKDIFVPTFWPSNVYVSKFVNSKYKARPKPSESLNTQNAVEIEGT
jgi:regulator of replication initiation timing